VIHDSFKIETILISLDRYKEQLQFSQLVVLQKVSFLDRRLFSRPAKEERIAFLSFVRKKAIALD